MTAAISPVLDQPARPARVAAIVLGGATLLTISAKLQVPFWPVPMTLQTLCVMAYAIAFGPRLAFAAFAAYLVVGAAGWPVFAGTPEKGLGLPYMLGPTGGYLFGNLLACALVGLARAEERHRARRGWPGRRDERGTRSDLRARRGLARPLRSGREAVVARRRAFRAGRRGEDRAGRGRRPGARDRAAPHSAGGVTGTPADIDAPSPDSPYSGRGILEGLRIGLPFLLSAGVTGMIMGLTYRELGFDLASAGLLSLLIFSGTAQAVTAGMLVQPHLALAPMALALASVNARYFIMSAHLRHLFPDLKLFRALPTLFLLVDPGWALTVNRAAEGRRDFGILCGIGLQNIVGWVGGTLLGFSLGVAPSGALSAGAAFLPFGLIVAVLPGQWRRRMTILPWDRRGRDIPARARHPASNLGNSGGRRRGHAAFGDTGWRGGRLSATRHRPCSAR